MSTSSQFTNDQNAAIPQSFVQIFELIQQSLDKLQNSNIKSSLLKRLNMYQSLNHYGCLNYDFVNFYQNLFQNQKIPDSVFHMFCNEIRRYHPYLPNINREERKYNYFTMLYGAKYFPYFQEIEFVSIEKFPKTKNQSIGAKLSESEINYIVENYQQLLTTNQQEEFTNLTKEISFYIKNLVPQTSAISIMKYNEKAFVLILGSDNNKKLFLIQNFEIQPIQKYYGNPSLQMEGDAPISTNESDNELEIPIMTLESPRSDESVPDFNLFIDSREYILV